LQRFLRKAARSYFKGFGRDGTVAPDVTDPLELTSDARDAAWSRWGDLDPYVLGHLINPTFMGGPEWPALRQAFKVARRPNATLIASDGLADPFDDGSRLDRNGFGLEVYSIAGEHFDAPQASWLFALVWAFAQQVASHGGIVELLDELELLSTELFDIPIPAPHAARFVNEEGRVGALVGLETPGVPHEIAGPLSPIRLVNLTLLTLEELAFVVEGGDAARLELAKLIRAAGHDGASSLTRASVI
jgi:hypothetical protein